MKFLALNPDPLSAYLTVSVSVQWIIGVATSILLFRLRSDREDMKQMETRLHTANEKLIDERMRGLTHQIKNHAQAVVTAMDAVKQRIDQQDESIEKLGEKDHSLDLKMLREIKDLQLEIVRNTATKTDLEKHQSSMTQQMNQLRQEVVKRA